MKKLIALLLAAVMCLSLAACGGTGNNNKSETEQTGNFNGSETEQTGDITDSSTESTEPIVTKEDMDGFWITSNGYYIIFDGDNIYSIESVEDYTDIESSAGFYLKDASGNERIGVDVDYGYSIEGNQLSFNTSLGEETFVYEILKNDDTLSLKFIEREREGACPNSKLPAVMIADLTKAYDLNKQPLLDASELEVLEALLPQEQTIEITLDNWQEYFEIRPNTYGALYDSFGEFERLGYVNWAMFLKNDVADKVTELEDLAIEYSFRDGYFCWFEYNLDTEEFVQKNAAAEGEVDSWRKVEDSNRDLPLSLYELRDKNGCFLVFINDHLSESLNDNIYSFIGEAYETMEIVRIKGTITISE